MKSNASSTKNEITNPHQAARDPLIAVWGGRILICSKMSKISIADVKYKTRPKLGLAPSFEVPVPLLFSLRLRLTAPRREARFEGDKPQNPAHVSRTKLGLAPSFEVPVPLLFSDFV